MSLYEQIRRAHERDGLSIRELSRRFEVHRRDIRSALNSPIPPPRKVPDKPKTAPKLDQWKSLIKEWVLGDEDQPTKQRHTARRVWERLVLEHGADIGESTVRRYVKTLKDARSTPVSDVMIVQDHELGAEAEVDFGAVHVELNGEMVKVSMFVIRLSASGKSFASAYLNEGQEAFLDGHVRGFNHFGGTPGRIRYDNLKAAVVKVMKGRNRDEAERFIALRSHYGYDSFFCVPGIDGAHEKGGVEGEVGRFRRRHLVPVPKVSSMSELNELLFAGCVVDDGRLIAHRRMSVGDHFLLEAPTLRQLPGDEFDTMVWANHRVDTKARISVRSVYYSVPAGLARRRVDARIGAERVEVFDGRAMVASHQRGRKGEQVLALDHYLEVLTHKPGALPGSTALAAARTSGVFTPVHDKYWAAARKRLGDRDGTLALIELLLAHRVLPAEAIVAGIEKALVAGSTDPAVVLIEARRCIEPGRDLAPVIPIGVHQLTERPTPTLHAYDDLLENTL